MANERTKTDDSCIPQLLSSAESAARPEVDRIIQAVIGHLQSRSSIGTFGDVAARHMWDEYCWVLQEGPFDDNVTGFGSLSANWDTTVRDLVSAEIANLPRHLQVFLSVYAAEHGSGNDEYEPGTIWLEAIEAVVMEKIAERASGRNLDLIGPDRGDVIGYEVSSTGLVCSALASAGALTEVLATHVDTLIESEADLSEVAREIVDAYIELVRAEAESSAANLTEFLECFEGDIKKLLTEKDVLPSLEEMQAEVLGRLDS